jgi:hypothetical protein
MGICRIKNERHLHHSFLFALFPAKSLKVFPLFCLIFLLRDQPCANHFLQLFRFCFWVILCNWRIAANALGAQCIQHALRVSASRKASIKSQRRADRSYQGSTRLHRRDANHVPSHDRSPNCAIPDTPDRPIHQGKSWHSQPVSNAANVLR